MVPSAYIPAQRTRLAIFRLLIKHEPVRITAGVIADTIGAPHKTPSTIWPILVRAGLLRSVRKGAPSSTARTLTRPPPFRLLCESFPEGDEGTGT